MRRGADATRDLASAPPHNLGSNIAIAEKQRTQ